MNGYFALGFPDGSEVKASASNAGDPGSIPGLGRSPGEGNGNPLQITLASKPVGHLVINFIFSHPVVPTRLFTPMHLERGFQTPS